MLSASQTSSDQEQVPSERRAGRERPNSRGEATRLLILETAERLFAERGITAVPLREIGLAAGQRNNVVVQYHFGDRERLLREITSYRARASEQVRTEQLANLFGRPQPPVVSDLVKAFVVSLVRNLEEGNHYLAFLSRYVIERGGYRGLEGSVSTSAVNVMLSMLRQMLPDYPEALLDERWTNTMTGSVHTLARYQAAMQSGTLPAPIEELIDDLVVVLSAGLEAPPLRGDAGSSVTSTSSH